MPNRTAAAWRPRLNWLRAAVLGANDGIVSTAGLVVSVAGPDLLQIPLSSPAFVVGRA